MYIRNNESVKTHDFVTDEQMIATVYAICPSVVFSSILSCDYFGYVNTIPEHSNSTILNGIMESFSHIISHHFIEVVEDSSFDYEYGDICSTHYETVTVGYVPRTTQYEEMACEGPWDDDYYW